MATMTSQFYIDLFNKAAGFARAGQHEQALKVWEALLDPTEEQKQEREKGAMTGDFLGQAMMRKAWTLMDLERYEDARQVFEDGVMQACLGQFTPTILFDYFFSYGNTLGQLGEIETMQDRLNRAFGIAVQELEHAGSAVNVLNNAMIFAQRARDWEALEQESTDAIQFADRLDIGPLKARATLRLVLALKGQGRIREARDQARDLLAFVEKGDMGVGADEVRGLLDDL